MRLRYHRNMKEKAFSMSNQKLEYFRNYPNINLDEIVKRVTSVKV
jgi:hypothetical protein